MSAGTGYDPLEGEELEEPVCTNEYVSLLRDRALDECHHARPLGRLLRRLRRGGGGEQARGRGSNGA